MVWQFGFSSRRVGIGLTSDGSVIAVQLCGLGGRMLNSGALYLGYLTLLPWM
jgi:hypothetical protein